MLRSGEYPLKVLGKIISDKKSRDGTNWPDIFIQIIRIISFLVKGCCS